MCGHNPMLGGEDNDLLAPAVGVKIGDSGYSRHSSWFCGEVALVGFYILRSLDLLLLPCLLGLC
jgi:hypothetical protein